MGQNDIELRRLEAQMEQLIHIVGNLNKRIIQLEYKESQRIIFTKRVPKVKSV
ncbi:hypothetical protein ACXYMX_03770 [Sporosarcina sp. CAU 1771]